MRRFRFVGDQLGVYAECFEIGRTYDGDLKSGCWRNVSELANNNPQDWEEVIKPLHKDTDLGMFSAMFVASRMTIDASIEMAKLLILELDKEVGGED